MSEDRTRSPSRHPMNHVYQKKDSMPHILDSLAEYRLAAQANDMRRHLHERTHAHAVMDQQAATKAATPAKAPAARAPRLPIPLGTTSAASRTAPADPDRHGTDGPCPPRVDCGSAALSRPA